MELTDLHILWPKPCVYALFYRGSLRWVGQSGNLPNRLYAHKKELRKFDRVWVYWVDSIKHAEVIEDYLLKQALPSENIRGTNIR